MAKRSNNNNQISLFPETVYEYHILLSPSDTIKEEVDALKQTLHEMVGIAERDRKSIAHITLLKTEGYESVDMKAMIKNAVAGEKKFIVKLNGHSHFEHGTARTLYLAVEDPEPIANLVELIKNPTKKRQPKIVNRQTSIIDKPVKPKPKKLSMIPHVTIAGNIAAADFERIEDFTTFETYQAEWLCDRITIRRRVAGTDKHFSPAGEVKLG